MMKKKKRQLSCLLKQKLKVAGVEETAVRVVLVVDKDAAHRLVAAGALVAEGDKSEFGCLISEISSNQRFKNIF
jgi:hypothetical protein